MIESWLDIHLDCIGGMGIFLSQFGDIRLANSALRIRSLREQVMNGRALKAWIGNTHRRGRHPTAEQTALCLRSRIPSHRGTLGTAKFT